MAASLTTLIPLESPRSLPGSPKTVLLDGQLWLGSGQPPLICLFRYFNATDIAFDSLGYYFLHANVSHAFLLHCNSPLNHTLGCQNACKTPVPFQGNVFR